MAVCEICGKHASTNLVGVCSECFWTKPETNRWGESVDWEGEYNVRRYDRGEE